MHDFDSTLSCDPEYLLRCSLTHDWEHVELFCDFLIQAYEQQTNNSAVMIQSLAMRQLRACDQYGNSVLHAVCYDRPPVAVVQAILRAAHAIGDAPGADTIPLTHHCALDLSSALQVACATGASVDVIQALLAASPVTATTPSLAETTTWADQQGATPLSDLVVQYTLERKGPRFVSKSRPLDAIVNIGEELKISPIFRTFWTKVKILVSAATTKSPSSVQVPVLHRVASICATCPPILTDLLLRAFPDEICKPSKGVQQQQHWLPLHFALTSDHRNHTILQQQQQYFIHRLLQLYPKAASIPASRMHPLCLSILKGLPWHGQLDRVRQRRQYPVSSPSSKTTTTTTSCLAEKGKILGPMQQIVQLCPLSLSQRDSASGLYPWQLAAIVGNDIEDEEESNKNDSCALDTIFALLRRYPQSCLSSHRHQ